VGAEIMKLQCQVGSVVRKEVKESAATDLRTILEDQFIHLNNDRQSRGSKDKFSRGPNARPNPKCAKFKEDRKQSVLHRGSSSKPHHLQGPAKGQADPMADARAGTSWLR